MIVCLKSLWFPFTVVQIYQNIDQAGCAHCRKLPLVFPSCVGAQPLEQCYEYVLHFMEAYTYQFQCHQQTKPQFLSVFTHT